MNWRLLTSLTQLDELVHLSSKEPVILFKHSTTCSISIMAKMRLEQSWALDIQPFYLDLKQYKEVSDEVADRFSVHHESPQLLLIVNGECVYDASHFDISMDELTEALDFSESSQY